jgi:hypothetical protein
MGLFQTFCDGHHIGRSYGAAILALKETFGRRLEFRGDFSGDIDIRNTT